MFLFNMKTKIYSNSKKYTQNDNLGNSYLFYQKDIFNYENFLFHVCKPKNLNIKPYCLMKSLLAWMKGNVGSIECYMEFFCLKFHPIHQEFMVSLQTFFIVCIE